MLWLHCILPSGILLATGGVAALVALVAGRVTASAFLIFVLVWIPVAPTVVLAAALSSRNGGRASGDLILMTSGDSTGLSMILILFWIFGWSIAAIVVAALGVGRTMAGGSAFAALAAATGLAVAFMILRSILLSTKGRMASEGAGSILGKRSD